MWWMALIGAAVNQISWGIETNKTIKETERKKGQAEDAYNYQKNYNDSMFRLQKGEALDTLGIQKNRLAEAFNMDLAGFNLGLEGQALGSHAARVGLSESEGAALAAQGASGTRGGDSLQMQIDYQENMFGRQMDLQDRGNSLAVNNMAMQYGNARSDIDREIDSWGPDGYRTRAKNLGDTYAANMHGLQMDDYQYMLDELNDPWNLFLGFNVAGFQGASAGMGMGASIDSYRDAWNGVGKDNSPAAAQAAAYQQSQAMANQQTARYYGRLPY